jgi:hypothetical protein
MRHTRKRFIKLALSEYELAALKFFADRDDLTVSGWVRGRLKAKIPEPVDIAERFATFAKMEEAKQLAKTPIEDERERARVDAHLQGVRAYEAKQRREAEERQRRGGR